MIKKNNFTMKVVEDFWDTVANVYEDCNDKIADTHYQRFTESIKYLDIRKNSKVLNIWSRTGIANKFLRMQESTLDITNAELSSEMIKIAKTKFPLERFDKVDLLNLPYSDEYFDEILSLETIEHMQYPLVFLKELYRVLNPHGKLVMSTPPATAEIGRKIYDFFLTDHGEGPHKFLSSRDMKQLLKEAGFALIKHKGTLLIPVGPKYLKTLGELIINRFQNTFISELGIRQFYVATKQRERRCYANQNS